MEYSKIKRKYNEELVEKYKFLMPTKVDGSPLTNYNYEKTFADGIPDGWLDSFGFDFFDELKEKLIEKNMYEEYRVSSVSDKFGRLCWYDDCYDEDIMSIVEKYVNKSKYICESCGRPADVVDTEMIQPFCTDCAGDISLKKYAYINDYYNTEVDET